MATLNIPRIVLSPGAREFGPVNVLGSESLAVLTIDRTVNGGLNSVTTSTIIQMNVEQSNDNGIIWIELASTNIMGGIYTIHAGLPGDENTVGVWLLSGNNRQVRSTVTVTGPSSVAVRGSLAVT